MSVRYLPWLIPLVFLGCNMGPPPESSTPTAQQTAAADRWIVESARDAGITSGILAQHTLFPYHFEIGREGLNDLGDRDLAVLAVSFRARPGQLNVRRGDASENLYNARVEAVSRRLAQAGVEAARVKIVDAPADGAGMPSERAVKILQRSETAEASNATSGANTGTSSNTMSGSTSEVPK